MKWISAGLAWCFAFGDYLLFTGTVSGHELATAAVLASGATAWALAITHCSACRFAFTRAQAIAWAKAIRALVPALLRTSVVLAKAAVLGSSPGRAIESVFLRGAEGDPDDRARRASAVLIASFAPDSFVVRAPVNEDRVLMHTILQSDAPRDSRWLTT
jgi:hypothetical protein